MDQEGSGQGHCLQIPKWRAHSQTHLEVLGNHLEQVHGPSALLSGSRDKGKNPRPRSPAGRMTPVLTDGVNSRQT